MKLDSIKPIRNQVFVKLLEMKDDGIEKTESGIFIYAKTKSKRSPMKAKILALGSTNQSNGLVCPQSDLLSVGDIVLIFPGALVNELPIDDEEGKFYLVRTEDLDCIIEMEE